MANRRNLRARIVDTALNLADETHWEKLRLHDIATRLDVTLNDIREHFREKEDITDAWFDRADAAMLARAEAPGFDALPARERIVELIMAWLDTLAAHRKATREMILGKLEFGHIHIQIPAVMRISRTVQWVREAAGRNASFARRALEETGLTTIYLLSFVRWMNDDSPNAERTRRFLERRLSCAERLDRAVWREHASRS
jgi:ubiquinone biosynthesis protein COQ9